MSLILDALKKLDREKKPLTRSGGADIAVDILRSDSPRPRRGILPYLAAAFFAAFVAAAITYSMMGKPGLSPQASSPSPTAPVTAPAAIPPVASPASQAESPTKPSPSPPVNPAATNQQILSLPAAASQRVQGRDARDEISTAPPKASHPMESGKPSASLVEKNASLPGSSKEMKIPPKIANKTAEPAPKEPAAAPPSLKLSGILWYENPYMRRAVINGMALPEGSVIEGVKVLEIHPARVRLSHNGRSFDLPMPP